MYAVAESIDMVVGPLKARTSGWPELKKIPSATKLLEKADSLVESATSENRLEFAREVSKILGLPMPPDPQSLVPQAPA